MADRSPVAQSRHSSTTRTIFRVLGGVLLLAGLFFLVRGGVAFAADLNADPFAEDAGFGPILTLAGGGFLLVGALAALNVGFLGAQSRYVSGETAGAVREFGSAFRGEQATDTADPADRSGPFCSSCGVSADREARFCDACGHGLASR